MGRINYLEDAINLGAHYAEHSGGIIEIVDNSTNAEIVPSISWTSEVEYAFVKGNFQYQGIDMASCVPVETEEELNVLINYDTFIYTDSACTSLTTEDDITYEEGKYYYSPLGGGTVFKDLTTPKVPADGRFEPVGNGITTGYYTLKLSLVNNLSKEVSMPVKGDKIGTVTVTIDAK